MIKKLIFLIVLLIFISGCLQKFPLSDEDFEIAKRSVQCFYLQRLKGKCWFNNKIELMDFYPIESSNNTRSYAIYMRFSPFNCADREPELEHCSKLYITNPMETCSQLESRHIRCEWNQTSWKSSIHLKIE